MMPDDDYPHPLGLHVTENRERAARASLAPATERVPQYDVELRLADEAVREWMAMAARLKSVVGCRATEKRRAAAEMAYDNLLRKYERPWLVRCNGLKI